MGLRGTGERESRRLRNENLCGLLLITYYSGAEIKKDEMDGHAERSREREAHKGFLVEKPEGKKALGRPKRRCEDNIK